MKELSYAFARSEWAHSIDLMRAITFFVELNEAFKSEHKHPAITITELHEGARVIDCSWMKLQFDSDVVSLEHIRAWLSHRDEQEGTDIHRVWQALSGREEWESRDRWGPKDWLDPDLSLLRDLPGART